NEGSAQNRSREPQRNVLHRIICRLRDPLVLHNAGQQRENSRRRKSQRTVAAKLGGLRYLAANVTYIDERSVEVGHNEDQLTAKLTLCNAKCKGIYFGYDTGARPSISPYRPTTMPTALRLNAFGLDNLSLEPLPVSAPGPTEVHVRLRAAALNYRDLMVVL